jgi:hypothetical protein
VIGFTVFVNTTMITITVTRKSYLLLKETSHQEILVLKEIRAIIGISLFLVEYCCHLQQMEAFQSKVKICCIV